MKGIKVLQQKLAGTKEKLERFRGNLDPFVKAAEEVDSTLFKLQETEKDLKVFDQEAVLRHEPVARLISVVGTTLDNFYNFVQENEARVANTLGPLSTEVNSYAGTVSTSGSTVYHLVRGAYYTARAYEPLSFPSPELPSFQNVRVYEGGNTRKEQEIEDLLREVDPVLVQKRKGAWEAFRSSNFDRVSQATHSMRETIRLLLDELAPGEKIKNTPWYTADPTSRSGVTRKHRIKYTLGGPDGECSESLLKMGVTLYDQLSNEAHSGNEPKGLSSTFALF